MKMKLKKRGLYTKLGLLMLLSYSFFYGLRYVILGNTAVIIALLFISLSLIVFGNKNINRKQFPMIALTLCCIMIIICNRNARFAHQIYMFDFGMIVLFTSFIFLSDNSLWHSYVLRILIVFGVFYSVTTILLFLFPQVYINYVNPLFGGGYNMIRKARQGLAIGFSNHYSTTGIYLAATIGVPIALFMRKEINVKKRWFYISLIAITFVALLLTGKRAHTIFSAIALLVCYYFMNSDRKMNRFFKVISIALAGVLLFYVAAQYFEPLNNIIIRFQTSIERGDVTLGRGIMIAECLSMFKSNVLIGTGWGSFTYRTVTGVTDAHNVFMQLLGENGIMLSIPFIVFIALNYIHIIKVAKRIIRSTNRTQNDLVSIGYSVFIQSFFLLYCLTGNPLYDFQFLCPYIIGCSIAQFYYSQLFSKTDNKRITRVLRTGGYLS